MLRAGVGRLGVLGIVIAMGGVICSAGGPAKSEDLCFAFIRNGDVFVQCGGAPVRITNLGDIENYALNEQGTEVAFLTTRRKRVDALLSEGQSFAAVFTLPNLSVRTVQARWNIEGSCGGIVIRHRDQRTVWLDAQKPELPRDGLVEFLCSSDRRVRIGVEAEGHLILKSDTVRTLAKRGTWGAGDFSLSPDGRWFQYSLDDGTFCVGLDAAEPVCFAGWEALGGEASLNNNGGLLVSMGTRQGCYYRSFYDFSPTKLDKSYKFRDECLGIGYRSSAGGDFKVVQSLGRNPSWITRETAAVLISKANQLRLLLRKEWQRLP